MIFFPAKKKATFLNSCLVGLWSDILLLSNNTCNVGGDLGMTFENAFLTMMSSSEGNRKPGCCDLEQKGQSQTTVFIGVCEATIQASGICWLEYKSITPALSVLLGILLRVFTYISTESYLSMICADDS